MNLNTLRAFRHEVYASFTRAKDALFNTVDALVTETGAQSFAELSLAPAFERRWSSLSEAFEDGRIERKALQEVLVKYLPIPAAGQRLLWGIDASGSARPQSKTSADRMALHMPNVPHSHTPPITVGWHFSTLVVLPAQPRSWSSVLDSRRIESWRTAAEVAAEQLREVVALLPAGMRPLLLGDRYSPSAAFLPARAALPLDSLLRSKRNRVFSRPAPARTGKRGAPRKDGARFACQDESTHGEPDARWQGVDEDSKPLLVERWDHLHLKQAREVELSVYRVKRLFPEDSSRCPRISWFIWPATQLLPPEEVPLTSRCRFGIEHGSRFEKQHLLWEQPRLRTPQQFERWTQIVAIAHNLLLLARPLVQALRQPWECSARPVTPQQVRRGMAKCMARLGTPAHAPQRRAKSPGRAKGTKVQAAHRFRVVKKTKCKAKKRPKSA